MTKKQARCAVKAARNALSALLALYLESLPPKGMLNKKTLRRIRMRAWKIGVIQADLRLLGIFLDDSIKDMDVLFRKGE